MCLKFSINWDGKCDKLSGDAKWSTKADKGRTFQVTQRFDGRVCKFVQFFIGKLSEKVDELDAAMNDDGDAEHGKAENEQLSIDGFINLPDDVELPFN